MAATYVCIVTGLILLPLSKQHNTTQITYKFVLCLLSNVSMLAIKRVFACYQMHLCLLSNASMLAIKRVFAYCQKCICLLATLKTNVGGTVSEPYHASRQSTMMQAHSLLLYAQSPSTPPRQTAIYNLSPNIPDEPIE